MKLGRTRKIYAILHMASSHDLTVSVLVPLWRTTGRYYSRCLFHRNTRHSEALSPHCSTEHRRLAFPASTVCRIPQEVLRSCTSNKRDPVELREVAVHIRTEHRVGRLTLLVSLLENGTALLRDCHATKDWPPHRPILPLLPPQTFYTRPACFLIARVVHRNWLERS